MSVGSTDLNREAFEAALVCVVDSPTLEIAHRVRNRRSIGTGVEDHNILTRNASRTAMNTPVATESGRSHQGEARNQQCASSHNGWNSTRERFAAPLSMVVAKLYRTIYPKIYR